MKEVDYFLNNSFLKLPWEEILEANILSIHFLVKVQIIQRGKWLKHMFCAPCSEWKNCLMASEAFLFTKVAVWKRHSINIWLKKRKQLICRFLCVCKRFYVYDDNLCYMAFNFITSYHWLYLRTSDSPIRISTAKIRANKIQPQAGVKY